MLVYTTDPNSVHERVAEHAVIVNALREGDCAGASAHLRAHHLRALQRVEEVMTGHREGE